jgi:DNA-binding NarL/FixJ family response regulator
MDLMNNLTKQERQILALVACGCRNAKIARELFISTRTVESHLYRIFQKLNVSSRTEAAIFMLQNDMLSKPKLSGYTGDKENSNGYYVS